MRKTNFFKYLAIAVLATFTFIFTGCPGGPKPNGPAGATDPNEVAATVNGTAIKMEEVERAIRQQAQGQESKLSQLELTQARLQVLEQLIQQEVMFQKAEAEATIPTPEEVTAAFNKMKTDSGASKEEFDKKMKEAGETEDSLRDKMKNQLAIQKLVDKISGKVEPPKDSEIEAFYNGNKEAFVKKRGVKLAAIVVDPRKTSEDDTTVDEASTNLKLKEIIDQLNQGADFATVAREKSEDPSKVRGGDFGYFGEDELKQRYPQLAAGFMDPNFQIGKIAGPLNIEGRAFIFKLQERNEKDENQTLETPGVRQQITDNLVNTRKQILSASYAAIAMNEAKIDNLLAKKVVENPNELSGARPATPAPAANSNTEANSNSAAEANANTNANANAGEKDDAKKSGDAASNTAAKPAASPKEGTEKKDDKK
ncbi:MAG: SurA N-terminal domain-containing protein [Acidobacteria bacterium]|nr:SurA N-terminal domain-containing protein [Acidobacteriota bacterium]